MVGRSFRLALQGEEAGQGLQYHMHRELLWIWWELGSLPLLEEWAFPVFTKSVHLFLQRNLKQSLYAQGLVFLQRAQNQQQWVWELVRGASLSAAALEIARGPEGNGEGSMSPKACREEEEEM